MDKGNQFIGIRYYCDIRRCSSIGYYILLSSDLYIICQRMHTGYYDLAGNCGHCCGSTYLGYYYGSSR